MPKCWKCWRRCSIVWGFSGWTLQLNSVGCAEDRPVYLEALREALKPVVGQMCFDCQRRAETNPLRVLDCKVPEDQPIIEKLPRMKDYLNESCREHFAAGAQHPDCGRCAVCLERSPRARSRLLHAHGVRVHARAHWGRRMRFSAADVTMDCRRRLAARRLPGSDLRSARIAWYCRCRSPPKPSHRRPDAYIAPLGPGMNAEAVKLARELRRQKAIIEVGDETFRLKKSLETASKIGARYAIILGENEAKSNEFALKNLATGQQEAVPRAELASRIGPDK